MDTIQKNSVTFCWLDLEMTGLDAQVDKILEIAALVTDSDNNILFEGLVATVHYDAAELPQMDPWVLGQHTKSGLLQAVSTSQTDLAAVEKMFYNALKPYCDPKTTYLAGNSVYQDKIFLKKYMPKINALFNYRIIDVSSIKVLVNQWYPESPYKDFVKSKEHRALTDIHESMAELAHYRKYFFKE